MSMTKISRCDLSGTIGGRNDTLKHAWLRNRIQFKLEPQILVGDLGIGVDSSKSFHVTVIANQFVDLSYIFFIDSLQFSIVIDIGLFTFSHHSHKIKTTLVVLQFVHGLDSVDGMWVVLDFQLLRRTRVHHSIILILRTIRLIIGLWLPLPLLFLILLHKFWIDILRCLPVLL